MLLFHLLSLMNGEEKNIKRMQNTGKNMDSIIYKQGQEKQYSERFIKGSQQWSDRAWVP